MPYPVTTSFKQELVKLTQDQLVECFVIDLASVQGYVSFNNSSKKIISRDRGGLFPITRILIGDSITITGTTLNDATFTVEGINEREITLLEAPTTQGTIEASLHNYLYFVKNDYNVIGWAMSAGEAINQEQEYTAANIRREDLNFELEGTSKAATMRVSVANVDRIIEGFIQERTYLRGCNLYILTAFAKHFPSGIGYSYIGNAPDYLSNLVEKFVIDGAMSNQDVVTFNCKFKFLFRNVSLPGRVMDRDFCSWAVKYKGPECDPTNSIDEGLYPTCDGTVDNCRKRGNSRRFGGFPGIPRTAIYV